MRPVPTPLLLALLAALCALCAWQWHRESGLRSIVAQQLGELTRFEAERTEILDRVKAADAEILRLTGTLDELRSNSIAKPQHEEAVQANRQMREAIEKQNEAIAKANASIQQANANVKALVAERDALAKRLNEVTALYNQLAKPEKP